MGVLFRGNIARPKFLDQVRVEIWFRGARESRHIQASQTQNQSSKQFDGACPHDGSFAGFPDFEAAPDLIRLIDSFLYDGRWFEQHADMLSPCGTLTMYSGSSTKNSVR